MAGRIAEWLPHLSNQSADRISTDLLFGVCVHHGQLPSGGVAHEDGRLVAISGSCWVDSHATKLSTPNEILEAIPRGVKSYLGDFGGSFALAYCDETTREFSIRTDRFGTLPIYYRLWGRVLAVSSEIKFLLDPPWDVFNREAVAEMMALGYILRPHTLVAGVQRLPAHQVIIFDGNGLRVVAMPTPRYSRNRFVDDEAIEEWDTLIQRNLARFVNTAPTFSIALSGGLDSRLLAASAQRAGLRQVAFSIGEAGSIDMEMADRVAQLLSIPIQLHELDGRSFPGWFSKAVWFTEGRVLPNHMHYMALGFNELLPPGPQLHGLVGEAILGGAGDSLELVNAHPDVIQAACYKFAKGLIYWHKDTSYTTFEPKFTEQVHAALDLSIQDIFDRIDYSGRYQDLLDFKWHFRGQGFTIPCLLSQVLPWTDVVSPFLDKDIYDFGATLEAKGLVDRIAQIRWAKNHMPIITSLPRVKDGIVIPIRQNVPNAYDKGMHRISRRAKINDALCLLSRGRINLSYGMSFPIYGQWYRRWRPVRDYVDAILLSDQCLGRGLWCRSGLQRLLRDMRNGRQAWNAVGTILLVELFIRQFIDGVGRPQDQKSPVGVDH